MKKILLVAACSLMFAACSSEQTHIPPLQLDYSSLGQIPLNVQDVNVINRAVGTPTRAPYVGHLFQPKLADAVTRWAQDRLRAAGTTGHATVIIRDASVVERPIPVAGGLSNLFTREQASKYVGHVEVDIEAQSPINSTIGTATAQASFATTLPEKPTEVEKNQAYREVLEGLMRELNQKLDQAIREHMAPFLTAGPINVMPDANVNTAEPIALPPAIIAPAVKPVIR